jgi:hypothetical protein
MKLFFLSLFSHMCIEEDLQNLILQEVYAPADQFIESLIEKKLYTETAASESLEYWLVSEWLANLLKREGQEVVMLFTLHVWVRKKEGIPLENDPALNAINAEFN